MRDLINLTDDQIEAVFWAQGYEIGIGMQDLFFTRETLATLESSSKNWKSYGAKKTGENYIIWESVLASKGQERRDFMVVDFGTVRAVYIGYCLFRPNYHGSGRVRLVVKDGVPVAIRYLRPLKSETS